MSEKITVEVAKKLAKKGYVEVVKRAKNGQIQQILKVAEKQLIETGGNGNSIELIQKAYQATKELKKVNKMTLGIGKNIASMSQDIKDISSAIETLSGYASIAAKLNWVSIGMQAANLVVSAAGFKIISDKLNKLEAQIKDLDIKTEKLLSKATIDINAKFKSIRTEYYQMLDAEKLGDEYTSDKLKELTVKMAGLLDYLYDCFMYDATNHPDIIMNCIYALLPMYTNVLMKYNRDYYYRNYDGIDASKKRNIQYDEWLQAINKLRSLDFLDKLQDYCFLEMNLSVKETHDAVITTYLMALMAETGIEDDEKIYESLSNMQQYRVFTEELKEEAWDTIMKTAAEIDEDVLCQINSAYRSMNAQAKALSVQNMS